MRNPPAKSRRSPRSRRSRGQAMVEYSMINWVLVIALVLGSTVHLIPQGGKQKSVVELFLTAYQTYYDSFYFILNSPFP